MGVLFRNAEAIEVLRKVDTLVVDKTGTLTEGKPRAGRASSRPPASTENRRCSGWPRASSAAASIRSRRRSCRGARSAACALAERRRSFESVTGKGVTGTVDGQRRGARQPRADGRTWASTLGALRDRRGGAARGRGRR